MKKVLITGETSYIGTSFRDWVSQWPSQYSVDTVSTREGSWKEHDFSPYDAIVHAAGIAHRKETEKNKHLYYKVNRDLAYAIAEKAKNEGVPQFIFLSSMSVFEKERGKIDDSTPLNPRSNYGKSKLEAEKLIQKLESKEFKTAIVRPPMVYGRGCKGNYPRLAKFAITSPIFFEVKNKRSMIYIDNLSEFLRQLIEHQERGIFHPQNKEYVSTADMVKKIADVHQRQIFFTKTFASLIQKINLSPIQKVMGNLYYSPDLSQYRENYEVADFAESILKTEKTR